MAKKRKAHDAAALEELDKTVFQYFTAAANSISQLYASAEAQRRLTFHAGEQHGLENVRQWIFARQEGGLPVTEAEILTYLQNELGYTTGDTPLPTYHSNQGLSMDVQMLTSGTSLQNFQIPQGTRQTKTFGFASAPTSPARGNLSLHMAQEELCGDSNLQASQTENNRMPAGNYLPHASAQLDYLNQEDDSSDSLDSEMDMNIEEHPNQYFP